VRFDRSSVVQTCPESDVAVWGLGFRVVQACPESDVAVEQARVEGNACWEGEGEGNGGTDTEERHQGSLMLLAQGRP
jgi:hypothetical protein